MPEPSVLRLFSFRPVGAAFISILRDIMLPDLRRMPGLVDVFLGRRGPDELGPRLNATVWASREAMVAGVGEDFDPPIFHPEYIDETTERVLEILPIAISMPFDGVGTPRILRTFRGTARPGELAAYIEEARNGTIADIDAGRGPLALHLATGPGDDDFVTISVWESWAALETATGATCSARWRPVTRNASSAGTRCISRSSSARRGVGHVWQLRLTSSGRWRGVFVAR